MQLALRKSATIVGFCLLILGSFSYLYTTLASTWFALGTVLVLLSEWRRDNLQFSWRLGFNRWLILLAVWLLVVTTYSVSTPGHNIYHTVYKLLDKYVILFFAVAIFRHRRLQHYCFYAFIAGVTIAALMHILLIHHLLPTTLLKARHFSGRFFPPQVFSSILAVTMYICLVKFSMQCKLRHLLWLIGAVFFAFVLYFQQSEKIGLVTGLVLLIVWLFTACKKHRYLIAIIPVLLLTLSVVSSHSVRTRLQLMIGSFIAQSSHLNYSTGIRLNENDFAWKLAGKHLILGGGYNSYKLEIKNAQDKTILRSSYPENTYLNLLVKTGLIGMLLVIGYFILLWRSSLKLPLAQKRIAIGTILTTMLACMTAPFFGNHYTAMTMIILLSICFGNYPNNTQELHNDSTTLSD